MKHMTNTHLFTLQMMRPNTSCMQYVMKWMKNHLVVWANISTNISTHMIIISWCFLNGATNRNKPWHTNTLILFLVYFFFSNFLCFVIVSPLPFCNAFRCMKTMTWCAMCIILKSIWQKSEAIQFIFSTWSWRFFN